MRALDIVNAALRRLGGKGPKVIGVDIAKPGSDMTVVVRSRMEGKTWDMICSDEPAEIVKADAIMKEAAAHLHAIGRPYLAPRQPSHIILEPKVAPTAAEQQARAQASYQRGALLYQQMIARQNMEAMRQLAQVGLLDPLAGNGTRTPKEPETAVIPYFMERMDLHEVSEFLAEVERQYEKCVNDSYDQKTYDGLIKMRGLAIERRNDLSVITHGAVLNDKTS